jgi:hypothetical protein
LEENVTAPVQKTEITAALTYATPLYPQKLTITSPTSGGPSVGIVRSRTQDTEFVFSFVLTTNTSSSIRSLYYYRDIIQHKGNGN